MNDCAITRFDEIYYKFYDLAINRFTWENLPKGLTSENLEDMIIRNGQVMAYFDNGLYILPCCAKGDLNVYGQSQTYDVYSKNGTLIKSVNYDDGIIIKNNASCTNDIDNIMIYSKRIDDIEKTQDVNLFQQNIPKILLTDEDGKLTVKNVVNMLQKFKFVIFGKKNLGQQMEQSNVLDVSAPYILDKLQAHKNQLFNEMLTHLGINNCNTDKKERLVVSEVNVNNEFIQIMIDLMYDLRKNACNEINTKFGTNIIVNKREVENGELYPDDKTISRE